MGAADRRPAHLRGRTSRVGGIAGAIGTLAEAVWSELSADEQSVARVLLLRLAGPGDGVGVVRRRVPLVEIEALSLPGLRRVLGRLAEARLLTIGDAHVEVAHEALFREWPRLRGWLTDDAAGRAVQRRLAVAASEWASEGREPGALWRGTRLLSGLEVASSRPEEVTARRAGLPRRRAGRSADAEERAVRERAAATARQNRRLRWLLVGAAVLLAVALVAGLLAMRARGEAEESATRAEASAMSADARRLAANALNEDRPALALLQAVEATQREQSPETYGALLTLLTRSPDIVTRFRVADRLPRIAASADGVAGLPRGEHRPARTRSTRSPGSGCGPRRLPDDTQWGTAAVDPRGRWLAFPLIGDPESMAMAVLDPRTGEMMRTSQGRGPDRRGAGGVPVGGRVGSPARPQRRADDGDARLRDRPRDRQGAAGGAVRPPRASTAGASGTAGSRRPDLRAEADPRARPAHRTPTASQPASIVGVDETGSRIITSRVTTDGGSSSYLQLRDARWRPIGRAQRVDGPCRGGGRSSPAGARSRSRGTRSWTSTTPRRWPTRAPWRDTAARCSASQLAGPARGLLWTAGRGRNSRRLRPDRHARSRCGRSTWTWPPTPAVRRETGR